MKNQELIFTLHELWREATKNCKHKDAKTMILDYTHVQMVHLCPKCYEATTHKHNELTKIHKLEPNLKHFL